MAEEGDDSSDYDDAVYEAMEKATYACQDASGTVPEATDWGAWIYSDAHAAMGGGVGGFVWFDAKEKMLDFFREHLAYLDPGIQSRNDAFEIAETCQEIVDTVRNGSVELRVGMTRLNHVVRGLTVIQWWGRLEDLYTSDSSVPCDVRSRFRKETANIKDDSSQITEDEETAFAQFLRTMI